MVKWLCKIHGVEVPPAKVTNGVPQGNCPECNPGNDPAKLSPLAATTKPAGTPSA